MKKILSSSSTSAHNPLLSFRRRTRQQQGIDHNTNDRSIAPISESHKQQRKQQQERHHDDFIDVVKIQEMKQHQAEPTTTTSNAEVELQPENHNDNEVITDDENVIFVATQQPEEEDMMMTGNDDPNKTHVAVTSNIANIPAILDLTLPVLEEAVAGQQEVATTTIPAILDLSMPILEPQQQQQERQPIVNRHHENLMMKTKENDDHPLEEMKHRSQTYIAATFQHDDDDDRYQEQLQIEQEQAQPKQQQREEEEYTETRPPVPAITVPDRVYQVNQLLSSHFQIVWSGICYNDNIIVAEQQQPSPTLFSSTTISKIRKKFLVATKQHSLESSSFRNHTTSDDANGTNNHNEGGHDKIGWNFVSYHIQKNHHSSKKHPDNNQMTARSIHAAKFHIYERIPYPNGSVIFLFGLTKSPTLNGAYGIILEYLGERKDMYLIKVFIPNGGNVIRIVEAKHVMICPEPNNNNNTKKSNNNKCSYDTSHGHPSQQKSNMQETMTTTSVNQPTNNPYLRTWTFAVLYVQQQQPTPPQQEMIEGDADIAKKIICSYLENMLAWSYRTKLFQWIPYQHPTTNILIHQHPYGMMNCHMTMTPPSLSSSTPFVPEIDGRCHNKTSHHKYDNADNFNYHEDYENTNNHNALPFHCYQDMIGPILWHRMNQYNDPQLWFRILSNYGNNHNNHQSQPQEIAREEDDIDDIDDDDINSSLYPISYYYMKQNKQVLTAVVAPLPPLPSSSTASTTTSVTASSTASASAISLHDDEIQSNTSSSSLHHHEKTVQYDDEKKYSSTPIIIHTTTTKTTSSSSLEEGCFMVPHHHENNKD